MELEFQSAKPSIKIKADEEKIRQVIQNLIDNAIKYMDTRSTPSTSSGQASSGQEGQIAINAGMLSALCAIVQNVENSPNSSLWSRMTKAWSVEQAYHAVSELALLMGAAAFRNDHFVAKALSDLRGFLFADGIHDALRRSAGRTLLDLPS